VLDEVGQDLVGLIREKLKNYGASIRSARNFDEFRYYCGRLEGIEDAERIVLKYFSELYQIKPVLKEVDEDIRGL